MSDATYMIFALIAAMFITFLVAWEAASSKYKEREFEVINDAFDAGVDSIIVQISTAELDRLAHRMKKALEEKEKRARGFSPDIDWQIQQAVDNVSDDPHLDQF